MLYFNGIGRHGEVLAEVHVDVFFVFTQLRDELARLMCKWMKRVAREQEIREFHIGKIFLVRRVLLHEVVHLPRLTDITKDLLRLRCRSKATRIQVLDHIQQPVLIRLTQAAHSTSTNSLRSLTVNCFTWITHA